MEGHTDEHGKFHPHNTHVVIQGTTPHPADSMKVNHSQADILKEKKLSNYLEHARTQEIPISKKETQLFNLRKKLGMNPTWGE